MLSKHCEQHTNSKWTFAFVDLSMISKHNFFIEEKKCIHRTYTLHPPKILQSTIQKSNKITRVTMGLPRAHSRYYNKRSKMVLYGFPLSSMASNVWLFLSPQIVYMIQRKNIPANQIALLMIIHKICQMP
jgi:hypothetical protein